MLDVLSDTGVGEKENCGMVLDHRAHRTRDTR